MAKDYHNWDIDNHIIETFIDKDFESNVCCRFNLQYVKEESDKIVFSKILPLQNPPSEVSKAETPVVFNRVDICEYERDLILEERISSTDVYKQ